MQKVSLADLAGRIVADAKASHRAGTSTFVNVAELDALWARLLGDAQQHPALGTDAVYIHGLSKGMMESCGLFALAASYLLGHENTKMICGNGSDGRGPAKDSQPGSSWPGVAWMQSELGHLGVHETAFVPTGPGLHTRGECDTLVELAKQKRWKSVMVVTVPYHWLRSLSCLVGAMEKAGYRFKVYFLEPSVIDLDYPMAGSQSVVANTTFGAEALADTARLFTYWDKGREQDVTAWKNAYGAPPAIVHRYLDWRDGTS